jgi:hypothetical protein
MSDSRIAMLTPDEAVAQEESPAAVSIAASIPPSIAPKEAGPRSSMGVAMGAAVLLLALGGVGGYIALKIARTSSEATTATQMAAPLVPMQAPLVGPPDAAPALEAASAEVDAGAPAAAASELVTSSDGATKRTKTRRTPRPPGAGTKASPAGFGVPMAGSFDD